jgi:hypothetical protein
MLHSPTQEKLCHLDIPPQAPHPQKHLKHIFLKSHFGENNIFEKSFWEVAEFYFLGFFYDGYT